MVEILNIPEIRNAVVPISVQDYRDICTKDPERYKKTELFRGMIIEKMTKSAKYDFFSQILFEEFNGILPSGYILRQEKGIQIQDSELEPDISIVQGSAKDFKFSKPTTARLIIEISVSSLVYDRNKAMDYSIANAEEYWILDAENEKLEVYTEPGKNGYKKKEILTDSDTLEIFGKKIELKKIFE